LASDGNFWELMATFGNWWHLMATFGIIIVILKWPVNLGFECIKSAIFGSYLHKTPESGKGH
jgi:hypothetical protein